MSLFSAEAPLALIGCGNMGQALARGWCASALDAGALVVLDRNPDKRADFYAEVNCRHVGTMDALAPLHPAAICLGIKPYQLDEVLPEVSAYFGNSKPLIMSMLAGSAMADYEAALWGDAAITRIMPNTPVQVGQGVSGLVANDAATPQHRDAISALMQSVGKIVWLSDEAQMHALTAVSGSGPAYVFYLMECFVEAAIAQGFSDDEARLLVQHTFLGAAQMAAQSGDALSTLRERVTSPNGTTQAGLEALMSDTIRAQIAQTVQAAKSRSETLMQRQ